MKRVLKAHLVNSPTESTKLVPRSSVEGVVESIEMTPSGRGSRSPTIFKSSPDTTLMIGFSMSASFVPPPERVSPRKLPPHDFYRCTGHRPIAHSLCHRCTPVAWSIYIRVLPLSGLDPPHHNPPFPLPFVQLDCSRIPGTLRL